MGSFSRLEELLIALEGEDEGSMCHSGHSVHGMLRLMMHEINAGARLAQAHSLVWMVVCKVSSLDVS